jgi:hypothetical protein
MTAITKEIPGAARRGAARRARVGESASQCEN